MLARTRGTLAAFTLAAAAALSAAPARAQNASPAAPAAKGLDDPTIVAIFDAANTWDLETGALAAKKSHNKDVRAYGRMLVRDHRMVRQQGRDLAKRLSVTPTPPGKDFALYQDHVAAMKTLRAARGAAFDKAFLEHEVSYHQAVIDAVKGQLLPATQNADLKALEVKVAPAFQAHMVAAQNLLSKTSGGTTGR